MQIMRFVKIGNIACPTMQSDKIEIMTSVEYISIKHMSRN